MVNVRGTRKALETALAGQDPQRLAQVFALPVDGNASKSGDPRKHNPQSLVIDGKDYGKLMTALMDTVAAGEVVSEVVSLNVWILQLLQLYRSHPAAHFFSYASGREIYKPCLKLR